MRIRLAALAAIALVVTAMAMPADAEVPLEVPLHLPTSMPSNGVIHFPSPCTIPDGGFLVVKVKSYTGPDQSYNGWDQWTAGPFHKNELVPLYGRDRKLGRVAVSVRCENRFDYIAETVDVPLVITAPLPHAAAIGERGPRRTGLVGERSRAAVPGTNENESLGSMRGLRVNAEMVGVASRQVSDPRTNQLAAGYWLAASDGGVFTYGNAPFLGAMGGRPLAQPIVDIAATNDGGGYWLLGRDGGVFAFGNAPFHGSAAGTLRSPAVALLPTFAGDGYWIFLADGGVLTYGDAPFRGAAATARPASPITAATRLMGDEYVLASADGTLYSFTTSRPFPSVDVARGDEVVGLACPPYYGGAPLSCVALLASGTSATLSYQFGSSASMFHGGHERVLDVTSGPGGWLLIQR